MKKSNEIIGVRIRAQREALGLTQEKASEICNISLEFWSDLERGVKGPSAETLIKICKGMSLSADYLLMGKKQETDISDIIASLRYIDPPYIPLMEEHIKIFIKTIGIVGN